MTVDLAFVLGSGMGDAARGLNPVKRVPFDDIDGVGACSVEGHRGEVLLCERNGRCFAIVLGRRHLYEGAADAVTSLLAFVRDLGARELVSVSAAGGLRRDLEPGHVVVVHDVIDAQYRERFTARRSPTRARELPDRAPGERPARVDPELTRRVEGAVARAGIRWSRGGLVCLTGPTYETHAEVAYLQRTAADVVTMSAAPEIAVGRTLGMRVAALAAVTNPATGIRGSVPGHDEVVEVAGGLGECIARMISELVSA